MKWIKTAIGAVIAVISIGIIATIVYKMIHPRIIKEVSFEIINDEETYYPLSACNEILEYGVIEGYGKIPNIVSGYVNNDEIDNISVEYYDDSIAIIGYITTPDGDMNVYYLLFYDGYMINGGDLDDDVTIKLVFAVPQPPQITGNTALLILLIPIVFAGGVLLYFYKPFKKERG